MTARKLKDFPTSIYYSKTHILLMDSCIESTPFPQVVWRHLWIINSRSFVTWIWNNVFHHWRLSSKLSCWTKTNSKRDWHWTQAFRSKIEEKSIFFKSSTELWRHFRWNLLYNQRQPTDKTDRNWTKNIDNIVSSSKTW